MKIEIVALLISLCSIGDIEVCPGVMMKTQDSTAVAQYAISPKSGKHYVLVGNRNYKRLSDREQKETLVHELAHGKVYEDHGVASHNHGKKFKKACKYLVEKTGVSMSTCKASI